jgi:hypothetical protein
MRTENGAATWSRQASDPPWAAETVIARALLNGEE